MEATQAKIWRGALANLDLISTANLFRPFDSGCSSCKSLEEAKTKTSEFCSDFALKADPLRLSIALSGADCNTETEILGRHNRFGSPRLSAFAPFAAFASQLEVFFQLSLSSSLISQDRASNRVDVGYLHYLPFCSMFVSSDRLHKKCAPLFLRDDQQFVWGRDLKSGLAEINEHLALLPQSEKEKGLDAFATWPPEDDSFLVTKLFDTHAPRWREAAEKSKDLDVNQHPGLVSQVTGMMKSATEVPDGQEGRAEFQGHERSVHRKKGNWYQLPKKNR